MTDIAIKAENVSKEYIISHKKELDFRNAIGQKINQLFRGNQSAKESFWALKDISFEIKKGDAVGIIGRNGAGKSTLLKILSRITEPTRGRFEIRGRVSSLLEVGTGFHAELSGRENIYLNGTILGMTRTEIKTKFDEIVDFSGVEKFLDTPVKHYSSGMKVRLAFSVAAHLEPEILIIDEVLAVGDAEFQKKCLGKMDEVSNTKGRTVIFVSHNLAAVESLCKTGLIIDSGKLNYQGAINNCIKKYLNQNKTKKLNAKISAGKKQLPLMIKYVEILSENDQIYIGDELTFKIHIIRTQNIYPYIGFLIKSENGTSLINANNRYQKSNFKIMQEGSVEVITCELGQVPLMTGKYSVDLFLGDSIMDYHRVEDAIIFDIAPKDVWGKGLLPPANCSHLWWPVNFKYK